MIQMLSKTSLLFASLIFSVSAYGANCKPPKMNKNTILFQNPSNKTIWISNSDKLKTTFEQLGFNPISIEKLNLKTEVTNLKSCTKKSEFLNLYTGVSLSIVLTSANACEDKIIKKLGLSLHVPSGMGSMEAPGKLVSVQDLLVCSQSK